MFDKFIKIMILGLALKPKNLSLPPKTTLMKVPSKLKRKIPS
jgi:hypothetical protein